MRWFGFLRAVNLGKRQMKMERLRAALTELGFEDVSTFIASGNCSFESPKAGVAALEARVGAHLEQVFGFTVETFLRTSPQVRAIATTDPFPGEVREGDLLQVGFLHKAPAAAVRAQVRALSNDTDRLDVRGAELWHLVHGRTMDSTLPPNALGRLIGSTTMRNVNTVRRIADKFDL
jgi:uncharacterized protein (DUF1697 family)